MEFIAKKGFDKIYGARPLKRYLQKTVETMSARLILSDAVAPGQTIVLDVENGKPEPDIYLLACKELGVDPGEAYAIEDSFNGIRSAYAAGMKPIMVPDMLDPDEEMREKSMVVLKDLGEVLEYLKYN